MAELLEFVERNPIAAVIAAGEIGFWILLIAGLVARYPLRSPRVGAWLLICVPLIDVVVLVATYLDLRAGEEADDMHGLAAVYLGFSVAFGHSMVRWADERFAHRFAGGPPPRKPPKYGWAKVRYEWREWGKFVIAWAISCGIILLFLVLIGERAEPMTEWIRRLSIVGVIWLAVGPVWTTISPPSPPESDRDADDDTGGKGGTGGGADAGRRPDDRWTRPARQ